MNIINKLRIFLERRTAPVTACVLAVAAVLLVAHALGRPAEDAGPDGDTYLRLGSAAAGNNLAECGNFGRSYWSPGWVMTIGAIQRVSGPRPLTVRLV
jgi:hypothetical protein